MVMSAFGVFSGTVSEGDFEPVLQMPFMQDKVVSGFSKYDKQAKIDWLLQHFLEEDSTAKEELASFCHQDAALQQVLDGFSENTLSNFP